MALLMATFTARAEPSVEAREEPSDLLVELDRATWGVVARYVKETLLVDQVNVLLPNMPVPTDRGTVWLIGPRLTVRFGDVAIDPGNGFVRVRTSASRITLQVPRMYIPVGRGVNCYNTAIHIGYRRPVGIVADIGARLVGTRIDIAALGADARIQPDNYVSQGPGSCHGLLIGNAIVRNSVARSMAQARQDIEANIRSQIATIAREAQTLARRVTAEGLSVDVSGLPLVRPGALHARVTPRVLSLTQQGARVGLDLAFRRTAGLAPEGVPAATFAGYLGAVSIEPEAVDRLLQAAFEGGSEKMRIDPEQMPELGMVFNREALAPAFPDLARQPLDREELQLGAQLHAAPRLGFADAHDTLRACVPSLELELRPSIGGGPVDYATTRLAACLDLALTTEDGQLALRVPEAALQSVTAAWAATARPRDRRIVQDELDAFFGGLLELLPMFDPLVAMPLPQVPVGGQTIGVTSVDVAAPYVRVAFGAVD